MKQFLILLSTTILTGAIVMACKKSDSEKTPPDTTPAELKGTEWVLEKFAVWNGYRIYHEGEIWNAKTEVWNSGGVDAASLDPDGTTGIYFGTSRFVSSIISSTRSGGGCILNQQSYVEGYPEFSGNKVIFRPKMKRVRSKGVCSNDGNFDRYESAPVEEYTWSVGTETDPAPDYYQYYKLTLTDKDGNSAVFYRKK